MSAAAPTDRPIVALDVGSRAEALSLVEGLAGLAGMFKIGSQLFIAEGPRLVREIVERGQRVFLDLKFHDIPNTVSRAAVESAALGVSMLTLHASGGGAMIESARRELETRFGADRPLLIAVTVLTSIDEEALRTTGVADSVGAQVLRLARLAADAGADGFVCSAHEVRTLRREFGPSVRIVVPGVRLEDHSVDDQKRVATPAEVVAAGADWFVIGRPVTRAPEPRAALERIVGSLD